MKLQKEIFGKEIKMITTSNAITKIINQSGAMKENIFEKSQEEEESMLFWAYELESNAWYEPFV